jgi:hypothetical protein
MKKERTVVLNLSNNFFRNPYLNSLAKMFIGVVVSYFLIILNANSITYFTRIDIVLFASIQLAVELILVRLTYTYLVKYVALSFGTLLIIPITMAATIAYMATTPYVMFQTTNSFLGYVVLFMCVRKVITVLIQGYIKRRKFDKIIAERMRKDV